MLVMSNYYQPITIIHRKLNKSITLNQGEIKEVDPAFADLPTFKNRVKRGVFVVSDVNKKEINEAKKKLEKSLDIPDDVKRDLARYGIPYKEATDKDLLLMELRKGKEKYEKLFDELQSKGIKVKKSMALSTLEKLDKENKDG